MKVEGCSTIITDGIPNRERSRLTARELLAMAGAIRSSSSSKNQPSDNSSTSAADDEENLLLNAADLSLGHNGSELKLTRGIKQPAHSGSIVGHSEVIGDIIYTRNSKFSSSNLDLPVKIDYSTLRSHSGAESIIQSSMDRSVKGDNPNTIEASRGGGVGEWVDLGASFVAHARLAMLYHSRWVQKVSANGAASNNDSNLHSGSSSSSGQSNSESDVSSSNRIDVNEYYQLAEEAAAVAMKVYRLVFCCKLLVEEDIFTESDAEVVNEEGGREGALIRSEDAKRSDLKMLYIVLKQRLFDKLCDTEGSNSSGVGSCDCTDDRVHSSEQSSPMSRLCYSKEYMKDVRRSMQVADLLPKQRGGRGKKKAGFTEGFNRIERIVNNHRVHFDTDTVTDTGTGGGVLAGHKSNGSSDHSVCTITQVNATDAGTGDADGASDIISSGSNSNSSSSSNSSTYFNPTGLYDEHCDPEGGKHRPCIGYTGFNRNSSCVGDDSGDDGSDESRNEEEKEEGRRHDDVYCHGQSAVRRESPSLSRTDESSSTGIGTNVGISGTKSIGIGGSTGIGDRGWVCGTDKVKGPGAAPLKGNKKDRRNAMRLEKFGAPKAPLPVLRPEERIG